MLQTNIDYETKIKEMYYKYSHAVLHFRNIYIYIYKIPIPLYLDSGNSKE